MESLEVKPPKGDPILMDTLEALSSEPAFKIIKTLSSSSNKCDSLALTEELKLSKKQFYITISRLSNQGIVKRISGRYRLTTFGKLILNSLNLVEDTIKIYYKTMAIDAIQASRKSTRDEILELVNILVKNDRVKEIIKLRYSL
jgi:Mn-dependent DtxR family transcriptional regulator